MKLYIGSNTEQCLTNRLRNNTYTKFYTNSNRILYQPIILTALTISITVTLVNTRKQVISTKVNNAEDNNRGCNNVLIFFNAGDCLPLTHSHDTAFINVQCPKD